MAVDEQLFSIVRIATTPATQRLGYAGALGVVMGFTTPSVTGVEVVGDSDEDLALGVSFDELEDAWFAPGLLDKVDLQPGTEVRIGAWRFIATADGEWKLAPPA
jgi:hypothetical protein